MLESIFIGMSGLLGYSRGLRVIANDTANLNTPGFKGSSLQFGDLFYSSAGGGSMPIGHGVNTFGTTLDFRAGELRQTGNPLDLAVNGQGLFVLRDAQNHLSYTRAGQFRFDADGVLVSRTDGSKVMAFGSDGQLHEIDLGGLRTNPAKATATVTFQGNLSSTTAEQSVAGVRVFDARGGSHDLTLQFADDSATAAGQWKVSVLDGSAVVGTGSIVFVDGKPVAASSKVSVVYKPAGQSDVPLVFDFGTDVTSFAAGDLSTLAVARQDGYTAGTLTSASFDITGTLKLAYSNGQTVENAKLALARFDSLEAVRPRGDNGFEAVDEHAWHLGKAGDVFGSIQPGSVEISNVDLSREFSDLVVMQRGYQASSQIVSTANDMLQELFAMKSK